MYLIKYVVIYTIGLVVGMLIAKNIYSIEYKECRETLIETVVRLEHLDFGGYQVL